MKAKLKPLVIFLSLLSAVPASTLAATNDNTEQLEQTVHQLTAQTEQLEYQLQVMQQQMAQMRENNPSPSQSQLSEQAKIIATDDNSADVTRNPSRKYIGLNYPADEQAGTTEASKDMPKDAVPYGHRTLANIGGTAVITSPFLNTTTDYGGGELIVNYSSINKDVAALRQRQTFEQQMAEAGLYVPGDPLVEISGELEGQVYGLREFNGHHSNDLNLTTAELDIQALINSWFTGFMSFSYDDTPTSSGRRTSNSGLALDQGFITLGNFNKSNFYATLGQTYVPFGAFSSNLISDPFTKTIFRTKARPLTVGYRSSEPTGPYAAAFLFKGVTREGSYDPVAETRSPNDHINSYGANLGFIFTNGKFKADFGTSYISNIADSNGMQSTGYSSPRFKGFSSSSADEVIAHEVPGLDLRGKVSYGDYELVSEFTTALRSFSPYDLTYNGSGARPDAIHVEGIYKFVAFSKPSNFAVGYDHSSEALGLNVPEQRYAATFNTSIWRNTLASLELRHDINYGSNDTASGNFGPTFKRTGKHQNSLIAQFDVYF